jgi:hypothetical protein
MASDKVERVAEIVTRHWSSEAGLIGDDMVKTVVEEALGNRPLPDEEDIGDRGRLFDWTATLHTLYQAAIFANAVLSIYVNTVNIINARNEAEEMKDKFPEEISEKLAEICNELDEKKEEDEQLYGKDKGK